MRQWPALVSRRPRRLTPDLEVGRGDEDNGLRVSGLSVRQSSLTPRQQMEREKFSSPTYVMHRQRAEREAPGRAVPLSWCVSVISIHRLPDP